MLIEKECIIYADIMITKLIQLRAKITMISQYPNLTSLFPEFSSFSYRVFSPAKLIDLTNNL